MGIETVGIIVGAVGAAAGAYGTIQAQKGAKKAAKEQEKAADVAAAQQKQEEMEKRRQQIREQRIRTAQIEQGAANAGVSGSSGEIGAKSGVQTVTASNIAFGTSAAKAAEGISEHNQAAAEANLQSQINQGIAGLGFNALNLGMNMGAANVLFGEGKSEGLSRQLDNKMNANPSIF